MSKNVIISGITGMDGSHMADYILEKTDYKVYGMVRRNAVPNYKNIEHLIGNPRFALVQGDLSDGSSINDLVLVYQPDYFINFSAQSEVGTSWKVPEQTFDINATAVIRILEAIRKHKPSCRFYQASSSEMWGDVDYSPQDEKHPFKPRSPYGASKVAGHMIVKVYRESYNLYAVSGILFNHESKRRGDYFVTQKICQNIARIKKAIDKNENFEPLILGNLDAKRDWSYSPDFIDGIWRMLNQDIYRRKRFARDNNGCIQNLNKHLKDYVLASGETHTVREFVELAFDYVGIKYNWNLGTGIHEEYYDMNANTLLEISEQYYRPAEVDLLLGDASKAKDELGWKPKTSFNELVSIMMEGALKNNE